MTRAAEILLIEDNVWDVRQVRDILAALPFPAHLEAFRDPREAMALLQSTKLDAGPPRPDLILLDLNLPYMHGSEVLEIIKSDPALRSIVVLVMTSSDGDGDREEATRHEGTWFATKPFLKSGNAEIAALIEKLCRESLDLAP